MKLSGTKNESKNKKTKKMPVACTTPAPVSPLSSNSASPVPTPPALEPSDRDVVSSPELEEGSSPPAAKVQSADPLTTAPLESALQQHESPAGPSAPSASALTLESGPSGSYVEEDVVLKDPTVLL